MSLLTSIQVAKFINAALAILLLVSIAALLVTGVSIYDAITPNVSGPKLDTRMLLGNPSVVPISGPGILPREAIFFPGQTGGPTIILAHGLRSQSSALLTLVAAFQDNSYNVLLFDFTGHGSVTGRTTLGYQETRELLAAVDAVAQRTDVDRERIGVWGHDLGAYSALAAASADGRIRAVAADSVYDSPEKLLEIELRRGPGNLPVVRTLCRWAFRLMNFSYRNEPPLSQRVPAMGGVAKLFIQAREMPDLAESTLALFLQAAEPRQQLLISKGSYSAMTDEEKRDYQKQVVSFFLQNLPPRSQR
jgi:pimeloyl-ACP methyl ester carboxylesterase